MTADGVLRARFSHIFGKMGLHWKTSPLDAVPFHRHSHRGQPLNIHTSCIHVPVNIEAHWYPTRCMTDLRKKTTFGPTYVPRHNFSSCASSFFSCCSQKIRFLEPTEQTADRVDISDDKTSNPRTFFPLPTYGGSMPDLVQKKDSLSTLPAKRWIVCGRTVDRTTSTYVV